MRWLVMLVLNLALFAASVGAEELAFAGLSRRTTVEELKKRYPKSSMVGDYMYVSNADSHDHIYGIEIPGTDAAGRLRLAFERARGEGAGSRPQYPPCRQVLAVLEKSYGSPTKVEEFSEESSRNRRLSWMKHGEVLSLHCFRMDSKVFLAEAVSITGSRP
ncbi:MAG: hypothetical protein L0387_32080 [Acidobacteria bacterium]|nr:hypothetical protein [Acidobacteriota bacterium]MCI0626232.1 hypothetical protein [Acidobacteriota bacterium]MCI0724111.1 hypothetical protein [Acidobacteriota bacterium]